MTDAQWRLVLSEAPPDRSTLAALYRRSAVDQRSEKLLTLAVRQLLNAGRGDEIVRLFDAREGKLSASSAWDALTLAEMGPNMALALRQAGRSAEAAQLLERTEASIRRSLRRGPAPHWYHAAAAQAWSAQGKREQALDALEKASAMGWTMSAGRLAPISAISTLSARCSASRASSGSARVCRPISRTSGAKPASSPSDPIGHDLTEPSR